MIKLCASCSYPGTTALPSECQWCFGGGTKSDAHLIAELRQQAAEWADAGCLHTADTLREAAARIEVLVPALEALMDAHEAVHVIQGIDPSVSQSLQNAKCVLSTALAAATGTAKTPKAVECEASQSGPNASEGNAQLSQPSAPSSGHIGSI
jgi:hypothetical protein